MRRSSGRFRAWSNDSTTNETPLFRPEMRSGPDRPPMTLGNAATAKVRLIVWCKACKHEVEPDPAELARTYGAHVAVSDWRARLVCSKCGSRDIDMVVTGERR